MSTTITASWSAPTTRNADGAPLASPIQKYQVQHYIGTSPLNGAQPIIEVQAPTTQVTISGVPNGLMGVRVRAVDTEGRYSPWTDYIQGNTTSNDPSAPGSFSADFTEN